MYCFSLKLSNIRKLKRPRLCHFTHGNSLNDKIDIDLTDKITASDVIKNLNLICHKHELTIKDLTTVHNNNNFQIITLENKLQLANTKIKEERERGNVFGAIIIAIICFSGYNLLKKLIM